MLQYVHVSFTACFIVIFNELDSSVDEFRSSFYIQTLSHIWPINPLWFRATVNIVSQTAQQIPKAVRKLC